MNWQRYYESTFSVDMKNPELWDEIVDKDLPSAGNDDLCDAVKYLAESWDVRSPRPPGVRAFIDAYNEMAHKRSHTIATEADVIRLTGKDSHGNPATLQQ